MRFLIIGFNYLPESVSIGPYTAGLAETLRQKGHDVQVITGFPNSPQWRVWKGYRGRVFMRERIHGVTVLRTWAYIPSRPRRTLNRILFDTSFAASALLGGLFCGKADLIVVISPPLQLGLTGWLLGAAKKAPFFLHIQDLVPDVAAATGMLQKGSLALAAAKSLERFVYRRSAGIGVISGGFFENLTAKGVAASKIRLLPNFIDLEQIRPGRGGDRFRAKNRVPKNDLLVMYSGSVALKQGLHTFVESAAKFGSGDGISFYLIGEGPCLNELKETANHLKLAHFHFLPLQPRGELEAQLTAADVLVITQRNTVTDIVFPGKLLYYLAAGRPILAAVNSESETGRFIERHRVGRIVPPEDPAALADAIRRFKRHPHEVERLGANGRRTAERLFDKTQVLKRFCSHLEKSA
jgi:colanic acid biosynthesis glycosyl transferase WcaI